MLPLLGAQEAGGEVSSTSNVGPALLLTHDCNLDKARPGSQVRIERLQFLPLADMSVLDRSRQGLLRKEELNPPEAFFVGQVGRIEAFVLLSEAFWLPASYFALRLEAFADHPEAEPEARRLVAGRHGNRLGQIEAHRRALLHQKIVAFWTRSAVVHE